MAALHGPRGSALLSNIFILLGCAALALSLSGNFLFGQRSAFTDEGQWWQGGMALFIEAMAAALSLFVGVLIAKRAYGSATAMGVLAAVFALASAYSLVGLGLSERVNKSRTLQANEQRTDQTARLNYEAAINASNAFTDTLDAKIAVTKDKAELAILLEQRREAAKNVPQMTAPRIASALNDPQAQVMAEIAKRTSVQIEVADFQLGSTIIVALLVTLGQSLCFACAGYTRPREEEEAVAVKARPDPLTPHPTIATANIVGVSNAERKPPSEPKAPPVRTKIPGVARLKMEGLEKARAERERIVQRFWDECVIPAPGNAIQASELHSYFMRWAESVGEMGLGPNPFGRALTKMQVKKREGAVSNSYLDIAIKPRGSSLNGYAGSNVTTLPLSDKRHFG